MIQVFNKKIGVLEVAQQNQIGNNSAGQQQFWFIEKPVPDQIARAVIKYDRTEQQADKAHIPPAIEKQRCRCKPKRSQVVAVASDSIKPEENNREKSKNKNV